MKYKKISVFRSIIAKLNNNNYNYLIIKNNLNNDDHLDQEARGGSKGRSRQSEGADLQAGSNVCEGPEHPLPQEDS